MIRSPIEQVAAWLAALTDHGGAVEIRAFGAGKPASKVFPPGTDPRRLAARALALDKKCKDVYLTLNPLRADLSGPARDADVTPHAAAVEAGFIPRPLRAGQGRRRDGPVLAAGRR